MKLIILGLALFSLNSIAQNNNPCSTTLNNVVSTVNSLTRVVSDSNKIAGNVTDSFPSYVKQISDSVGELTHSITDFQDFVEGRTNSGAIVAYIATAGAAAAFITTSVFFTWRFWQWAEKKFVAWKFPDA